MVPEVEACDDCTRRCLIIHGKKGNGPDTTLSSFFKVMIGNDFSKILLLPPKFARTVSSLVDQKIDLEDSSGHRWGVTLSDLNGCLAFQEGWRDFAIDHGLQVGDFVSFHYIMGSHFVVQIYTRSGCVNLDFPWEKSNCKKRKRCSRYSVAKDGSRHAVNGGYADKQGSDSSTASKTNVEIKRRHCNANDGEGPVSRTQPVASALAEELIFMVDRDLGYRGECRETLLDLSSFEMCSNKAGSGRDENAVIGDGMLQAESDLVGGDSVAEEAVGTLETSNVELQQWNNGSEVSDNTLKSNNDICNGTDSGDLLAESLAKQTIDGNKNQEVSNKKLKAVGNLRNVNAGTRELGMPQKEHTPISTSRPIKRQTIKVPGICDFPVTFQVPKFQSGMKTGAVKKERADGSQNVIQGLSAGGRVKTGKEERMEAVLGGENVTQGFQVKWPNVAVGEVVEHPFKNRNIEVAKIVKTEPLESISLASPIAANISCLVPKDDQSFLELPKCLPLQVCGGRSKMLRKVVLLKDSATRLWPVLYHDKYSFKILGKGWESFCKGNDIRPGDECVFSFETETTGRNEAICRVQVNR